MRWQAVAVVGEAGVGKTRLRREFLAWVARQHPEARVLTGRCYIHTQATPYYLVGELMQALFDVGHDDDAARALTKLESGLQALDGDVDEVELAHRLRALAGVLGLPLKDDPWHGLEPRQRRRRISLALERILVQAVGLSPLVVVAEDVHWAGESSLAFLDCFLRAIERDAVSNRPALLLVISRPPAVPQVHSRQLLARMEQSPHRTLVLRSLDGAQSNHLVAELLRREVHCKVAEWLEAHAGERAEQFVPLIAYHYERAGVRSLRAGLPQDY